MDGACSWKGKISELWTHTAFKHNCGVFEREKSITFLWNLPEEDNIRVRPRLLKIKFPSYGNQETCFILEHLYRPVHRVALFMVRSMDPDVRLGYSITIQDRQQEEIGLVFRGLTMSFESEGAFTLDDYPNCDLRQVFQVPLMVLDDFTFVESDGNQYFSVQVKFDIPPKETYESQ